MEGPTVERAVDERRRARPTDECGVEVRPYRAGDETEIVAAFNRVFPWARRTVEEWRWQFAANPEALRCYVAALPEGRVVAQFTGLPRRARIGRTTRSFSEIVDSFADPEFRAGLKKPGVFARTAYAYIDRHCRADEEAFAYGLPNPDAYRVGRRLLGYEPLGDVRLFVADAAAAATADLGPLDIEETSEPPADVDDLCERAAAGVAASVVRDRRYLAWRYARPGVAYRHVAARDARRELVASFVFRDAWLPEDFGEGLTVAAEALVDPLHPCAGTWPAALLRGGAAGGGLRVGCAVPVASRHARDLTAAGLKSVATKFHVAGRTYDPVRFPLSLAASGWFWTLGDFDVV
jgi:hypothetical protein